MRNDYMYTDDSGRIYDNLEDFIASKFLNHSNYKETAKKCGLRKIEKGVKEAVCLKCHRTFKSKIYNDNSFHKICPRCKRENAKFGTFVMAGVMR